VGKGGVVRDQRVHEQVIAGLTDWSRGQPWQIADVIPSPIKGPAGNVEFLSLWRRAPAIISPGAAPADHS
jgi:23S rRNA (cytidine1920-2'-O)/16S rRNA (cytidine1409-2'-O)-methyltransferase